MLQLASNQKENEMALFIVDVEADGPYPGDYSMVSFGIVKVQNDMASAPSFYGKVAPISDIWLPEALAVSGHTREETLSFDQASVVMPQAMTFVNEQKGEGHAVFISDNNGFDWQFINYYMHKYAGSNPFGFSSRRIGDFFAGLERNFKAANNWKRMRTTAHDHNPVNDARGNGEALIAIAKKHNITFPL
jgi:DNA polymerase III epsilon subunit-like protein